jgi:hypothetical protein
MEGSRNAGRYKVDGSAGMSVEEVPRLSSKQLGE